MITLKEYAKNKQVSYEAVRKQVVRYKDELGEHLIKKDRTQYLDDVGVEFLDGKRAANPVIVMEHDKDQQIENLKNQLSAEQAKNSVLKDQIIALQNGKIEDVKKIGELQQQLALLTAKEAEEKEKEQPETEKKGFWARLLGL